jgi:two-component system cell cycle sensor histidine kinase/response regulator CckA
VENKNKNKKQLFEEIEELRTRLQEAEETLNAVRSGEVDAIVVSGLRGEQVFTLTGAERVFRVLVETMNEGAASLNQEGLTIYCNQRFSEMIKTPLEKVIGTPMRQFIRPSDLPAFDSLLEKGSQKNCKGEVAFINNDGTELPVLLSISALQGDNANIFNIVITDLTAQKQIEEELRRHRDSLEELVKDRTNELEISNQQLREEIIDRRLSESALIKSENFVEDILGSIDEAFVVVDRDYRIQTANRAYCELAGKPLAEIMGKHCYEVLHHVTRPCYELEQDCACKHTFTTGEPAVNVHMRSGENGKREYVELKTFAMKNRSGEITSIIEILNDITEKRSLENQLQQAQKMEAIGTLAGGIAHDFNNILSAIIGYGHVTLMKMPKDDPLRLNIEHILESADRAATLTQSLLAFSRKQIFDRKPVDLNTILKKVEKFLVRVIGEDVVVRLGLAEGALTAFADAGQLEQVFMNLATNARDAMPNGGLFSIETSSIVLDSGFVAAHGFGKPGRYALVSATDTGVGMNEETRKKIFEPFFTTKEVDKGTGLGLAMVYGIIKQHDGFINVYSEPGKGTTFRIYLPLITPEAVEAQKAIEAEYPKGGTETILLAEDDANLRKLSVLILEQGNYTVITANDGDEAVKKFMENKDRIQLLLFDIIMPKKNGREAYEEIRQVMPDVPVLFASGYSPDMLRDKALIEKDSALIYKPVSPQNLLKKVREVLDGAR